jgi:hypothetical protein
MKLTYIASLVLALPLSPLHSQTPISISLDPTQSSIYRDQPFIISVTVTNPGAQYARRWNMSADGRVKELDDLLKQGKIKREQYELEKKSIEGQKKKASRVTIGSPASPWYEQVQWSFTGNGRTIASPFTYLSNPASEAIADVDGQGIYTAWFGISPEKMQQLAPGNYSISATLQGATVTVSLEVKNLKTPATASATDSLQLQHGYYYWHANEPAKGLVHAENILTRNPASIAGLSLKGDLLVLQNQWDAAWQAYTRALGEYNKKYPGSKEMPEYLMVSIEFVKGRMVR